MVYILYGPNVTLSRGELLQHTNIPNNMSQEKCGGERKFSLIFVCIYVMVLWVSVVPWKRRAFDRFLAVLTPSPKIRRNHFSAWSAVHRSRRRYTHHLLCLTLPASKYIHTYLHTCGFDLYTLIHIRVYICKLWKLSLVVGHYYQLGLRYDVTQLYVLLIVTVHRFSCMCLQPQPSFL